MKKTIKSIIFTIAAVIVMAARAIVDFRREVFNLKEALIAAKAQDRDSMTMRERQTYIRYFGVSSYARLPIKSSVISGSVESHIA
jgi:hypothetical protein